MRIRTALILGLIILGLLFLTYRYGHDKSLSDFRNAALQILPKILIAFLLLVLAQVLIRLLKPLLYKLLGKLQQRHAILATFSLVLNVVAVLAALSVLVGSVSTFIPSLGLVGLGITWALQTPILCFTGWILINVRAY